MNRKTKDCTLNEISKRMKERKKERKKVKGKKM